MHQPNLEGLRDPAVVIAFSGWNDAANSASDALLHIMETFPSSELEALDDEHYFDFQVTRPILRRSPDGPWIQWPHVTVQRIQLASRDLIVAVGPEPNQLWRTFATDLVGRLKRYTPSLVVLLGAMLSDTPHTRPLPVAVHTYDPVLRERLSIEELRYEGPVGITGVVNQALIAEGLPSASMWVSIPHYVGNAPNPKAQYALLNQLEPLLDASLGAGKLLTEANDWAKAVDELSAEDPDVAEYIEQLEEAKDASDAESVTGDAIAEEFERYLRDQG
jgi:hypothetical protein